MGGKAMLVPLEAIVKESPHERITIEWERIHANAPCPLMDDGGRRCRNRSCYVVRRSDSGVNVRVWSLVCMTHLSKAIRRIQGC